jgi:transposase
MFKKKDADNEYNSIDATIVRASQYAAGAVTGQANEALGRSRGGFSTKIHCKIDALGYPLRTIISGGEEADIKYANALVNNEPCDYLLADRGYDADQLRKDLQSNNTTPVIPGRSTRLKEIVYDKYIYQERNMIERFFNRLKNFRRLATRYDKRAYMFQAFITLFCVFKWFDVF